jgi:multiple sugar transport system permease protein
MKKQTLIPWIFLMPFLISLSLFFVYASMRAFMLSFTNYNLFNEYTFIGIENYKALFRDSNFLFALRNTVFYALFVTIVQTFFALVLAALLNIKIRGINFFRAGFYLPSVTSSVVITVIFLWLFQRRGMVNFILSRMQALLPSLLTLILIIAAVQTLLVLFEKRRGMPVKILELPLLITSMLIAGLAVTALNSFGIIPVPEFEEINTIWLNTRESFMGIPRPLWAIIIQNIFTTIPTLMLIFLAGLQDVPPVLYEAARIDGAGPYLQFRYITIPSIRPVLFLVLTLSLIGTLQMFDQVAIYGDAVPLQSVITLAYYVYNRMFPGGTLPQVGMASAAAMFLAAITIAAVILQRLLIKSEADR